MGTNKYKYALSVYFEFFSLGNIFASQDPLCANIFTVARATIFWPKGLIPQFA